MDGNQLAVDIITALEASSDDGSMTVTSMVEFFNSSGETPVTWGGVYAEALKLRSAGKLTIKARKNNGHILTLVQESAS